MGRLYCHVGGRWVGWVGFQVIRYEETENRSFFNIPYCADWDTSEFVSYFGYFVHESDIFCAHWLVRCKAWIPNVQNVICKFECECIWSILWLFAVRFGNSTVNSVRIYTGSPHGAIGQNTNRVGFPTQTTKSHCILHIPLHLHIAYTVYGIVTRKKNWGK